MTQTESKSGRNAALVAAGILLSRVFGLVRNRVLAHVFGNGIEMAAFTAAFRIPNALQNLLGEGVLSASFIPVYASLRAAQRDDEARRVAGAVFGLLSLTVAGLVSLGLAFAPQLVALIAVGFSGHTFELTVQLVRIIFPATGVLVLSAWCLGVLNSHKRFFLSYAAPVVSSAAVIVTVLAMKRTDGVGLETLIVGVGWATVGGAVLQFAVQLPQVVRLLGRLAPWPSLSLPGVRSVVSRFVPTVGARGVVQISAWVDASYASLISERAVAALGQAQTIALLPISLFGMAISAAELPEMAADATLTVAQRDLALKGRLKAGLERMSFFVIPSAVAFIVLGDLIAGVLLQSGKFTARESRFVWYLLLGSGLALLAQTSGRLFASAFYALNDTRPPLAFAVLRVTLGIALGYYAVRIFPLQVGLPTEMGAVFVTMTTSVTAWVEMTLLRRGLGRRLGGLPSITAHLARVWFAAIASGLIALGCKVALASRFGVDEVALQEWGGWFLPPPRLPVLPTSLSLLAVYGVAFFVVTFALGVPHSRAAISRIVGRFEKR